MAVLELIAAELRNTSHEESPIGLEVETRFVPTHLAPLINALWFTSLTFSLGVAFVGLLIKQWLGEYTVGLMNVSRSRVSRKHAHARQHRHDALHKWRVQTIMSALPVMLQIALIFFLIGLAELFMGFDRKVGIVALSFLIALVAFSLTTSVLPAFIEDCSYRSPQALALYVLGQFGLSLFRMILRGIPCTVVYFTRTSDTAVKFEEVKRFTTNGSIDASLWNQRDTEQPKERSFMDRLKQEGGRRVHWSWRDREEAALLSCQSSYEARMLDELDRVKMDVATLRNVVQPCLRTLPLDQALKCVRAVLVRRAEAVVGELPYWEHGDLDRETLNALVDILLDLLERPELVGDVDSAPRAKEHEDAQWQLLQMLERLVIVGNHFALLERSYERFFKVLMAYRKETMVDNRKLVYVMLSSLGSQIPPSVVSVQGK